MPPSPHLCTAPTSWVGRAARHRDGLRPPITAQAGVMHLPTMSGTSTFKPSVQRRCIRGPHLRSRSMPTTRPCRIIGRSSYSARNSVRRSTLPPGLLQQLPTGLGSDEGRSPRPTLAPSQQGTPRRLQSCPCSNASRRAHVNPYSTKHGSHLLGTCHWCQPTRCTIHTSPPNKPQHHVCHCSSSVSSRCPAALSPHQPALRWLLTRRPQLAAVGHRRSLGTPKLSAEQPPRGPTAPASR